MAQKQLERSIAQLPDAATAELVNRYSKAADLLKALIAGAVRKEALKTARERKRQLAAVEAAIASLGTQTEGLASTSIAGGYHVGARAADLGIQAQLPSIAEGLLKPKFAAGANRRQVQVMQLSVESKLSSALLQVGRSTEDVFRRVGVEEVATGIAAGLERRKTSASIATKLSEEGITGFVDKAGRNWRLDVYAAMVARTTQREASTLGTVDRLTQVGLDLITVSKHSHPTDSCTPFEGKTFSLTGKTEGYEVLERLPPFHPNCSHVIYAAAANLENLLPEAVLLTAA